MKELHAAALLPLVLAMAGPAPAQTLRTIDGPQRTVEPTTTQPATRPTKRHMARLMLPAAAQPHWQRTWFQFLLRPVALSYDTNVSQLGPDSEVVGGFAGKGAWRVSPALEFDFGGNLLPYSPGAPPEKSLVFGLGAKTAHTWHESLSEFDDNSYAALTFLKWEPIRDIFVGLEYEYTLQNLNRDGFLDSHRLTPFASKVWRWDPTPDRLPVDPRGDGRARIDLYYNFDWRDYHESLADARLNRDGDYHAFGARLTCYLSRADHLWNEYRHAVSYNNRNFGRHNWLEWYLGYEWSQFRTAGTEFDHYASALETGLIVPLPGRFSIDASVGLAWPNFKNPSIYDAWGRARFDFRQEYDLGLSWTAVDDFDTVVKIRAGVLLVIQDSNITDRFGTGPFEFTRAVYGVQVEFGFRESGNKGISAGARTRHTARPTGGITGPRLPLPTGRTDTPGGWLADLTP